MAKKVNRLVDLFLYVLSCGWPYYPFMARPVLLFDCDGVLSDFSKKCLEIVKELTGEEFSREDVVDTFHFEYLLRGTHLEQAMPVVRDIIDHRINTPEFCMSLAPVAGVRRVLDRLRDIADVYVVTTLPYRTFEWAPHRVRWLEEHMNVSRDDVIFTKKKYLVQGDVFVDDIQANVEAWARAHPRGMGVLWSQNSGQVAAPFKSDNIVELRDWNKLIPMIIRHIESHTKTLINDVDSHRRNRV